MACVARIIALASCADRAAPHRIPPGSGTLRGPHPIIRQHLAASGSGLPAEGSDGVNPCQGRITRQTSGRVVERGWTDLTGDSIRTALRPQTPDKPPPGIEIAPRSVSVPPGIRRGRRQSSNPVFVTRDRFNFPDFTHFDCPHSAMPSRLSGLSIVVVALAWAVIPVTGAVPFLACAEDRPTSSPTSRSPLPSLARRLEQREPIRIVCLGDSVTGVYYHTGGIRAYPELLAEHLRHRWPDSPVEVRNAGISGHTTLDGLNRLDSDVLRHQPHVVTIQFGLNDMTRVPPADFRQNLSTLVKRCREVNAEVVLCTPNGILDPRVRGGGGRAVDSLEQFAMLTRDVARELQVPLCDLLAGYQGVARQDPRRFRWLMSDQIHPNLEGHRLSAAELARVLSGPSWPGDPFEPGPLPVASALAFTRARAAAGEPIRLLAMGASGPAVLAALRSQVPGLPVQLTSWEVAHQTLAEIEAGSARVRQQGPHDLVVIAIPPAALPTSVATEAEMWSGSWILNNSLAFGQREWDVLVAAPSLEASPLTVESSAREEFVRRLVHAQDLPWVARPARLATSPAAEVWAEWIQQHWSK